MAYHNFATPTALNAQVALEVAVSALSISGGDQTTITNQFPTGSTWPTLTQIETAENFTRALYESAMTTARATGSNASVAAVNAVWDGLCGFQNIFDKARENMLFALTATS